MANITLGWAKGPSSEKIGEINKNNAIGEVRYYYQLNQKINEAINSYLANNKIKSPHYKQEWQTKVTPLLQEFSGFNDKFESMRNNITKYNIDMKPKIEALRQNTMENVTAVTTEITKRDFEEQDKKTSDTQDTPEKQDNLKKYALIGAAAVGAIILLK